jgi:hypothetical protein
MEIMRPDFLPITRNLILPAGESAFEGVLFPV